MYPEKTILKLIDCLSRNPVSHAIDSEDNLKIVNFIVLSEIIEDQSKLGDFLSDSRLKKKKVISFTLIIKLIIEFLFPLNFVVQKKIHNKFGYIGPKQIV